VKRESMWGESSETFLDLVKTAILIVVIAVWGVPMVGRAWEMRAEILDVIWRVYGL